MPIGIKLTAENVTSFLIHIIVVTNGETVWFHAVIVSYQALAALVGSFASRRIEILSVIIIEFFLSR